LFLLCYSDSVCQVTGDWRKLCNVKLLNVYYTVNIVSLRWAGRDGFVYLSVGCMIIVRHLGRTTYRGVNATKLSGIS
jgi:hypothetical protein